VRALFSYCVQVQPQPWTICFVHRVPSDGMSLERELMSNADWPSHHERPEDFAMKRFITDVHAYLRKLPVLLPPPPKSHAHTTLFITKGEREQMPQTVRLM